MLSRYFILLKCTHNITSYTHKDWVYSPGVKSDFLNTLFNFKCNLCLEQSPFYLKYLLSQSQNTKLQTTLLKVVPWSAHENHRLQPDVQIEKLRPVEGEDTQWPFHTQRVTSQVNHSVVFREDSKCDASRPRDQTPADTHSHTLCVIICDLWLTYSLTLEDRSVNLKLWNNRNSTILFPALTAELQQQPNHSSSKPLQFLMSSHMSFLSSNNDLEFEC